MLSSDTDSWTGEKQVPAGACHAYSSSSVSSKDSIPECSDWSDSECLQDPVTQKRRHGVYFHRPPVWVSGSSRTMSQSTAFADWKMRHGSDEGCMSDRDSLCEALDALYKERGSSNLWPANHDQQLFSKVTAATADVLASIDATMSESAEVPLLVNWENRKQKWRNSTSAEACSCPGCRISSDEPLPNSRPSVRSYRQVKPGFCTRLKFQKDIRLETEERWAIQEGSLVICLDPSYTLLGHERQSDEFEIVGGDVYVVCRIYADLWALCAKALFIPQPKPYSYEATTRDSMGLGFLPLCAATLAANFSAFTGRCLRYACCNSSEPRHPGNGLPVMPPPRSHSLTASKQVFKGHKHHLELPDTAYDTFRNTSLSSDSDYIPLDSTLEQVLTRVGSRRRRPIRLGDRFSLQKIWNDVKASGVWKYDLLPLPHRNRSSSIWVTEGGTRHHLRKKRGDRSPASEKLKFLIGLS
ncbi:uncharacterized protein BDW43DRAFT_10615 [Aspergillus alliaceus]|uniref:uncharacterized protein n=1 Tax=Petromyces alliaceus TaxID=209559 RepID=UPI0012A5A8BD|nr:uncharacterized protein BDW43DRAFT_10615 [Aspergillus alliaceus]KAB8239720.1 hypothetical protein BDW43DRAFT_10615 [Aspergillus alliaceus]